MGAIRGALAGRARWVAAFVLLLCALSAAPVLAGTEPPQEPPSGESRTPSGDHGPIQLPGAAEIGRELARVEREEAEREEWLASPEATKQREASWLAYGDLSAADSEELLRTVFAEQLAALNSDPARFLSDAQLVRPIDGSGAVVREEGDTSLLESSVPARAEDEDGNLAKVDLSLEATADGFKTANAHVDLSLPRSADGTTAVGEEGFAIAQVGAAKDHSARRFGDKNLYFHSVLPATDLLVAGKASGAELFNVLRSKESPEHLRFDVSLPEGAALRPDGYGGAEVVRDEKLLMRILPPTAVDAQGTDVPVELEVERGAIVLHVPHRDGDYAAPILVDPIIEDWVNNGWYWGQKWEALSNRSSAVSRHTRAISSLKTA